LTFTEVKERRKPRQNGRRWLEGVLGGTSKGGVQIKSGTATEQVLAHEGGGKNNESWGEGLAIKTSGLWAVEGSRKRKTEP